MDYTALVLLVLALLLPCCVWPWRNLFIIGSTDRKLLKARLPPGPRRLPIIGNLLELGDKPHHSLRTLSKTYGPVMSLKLGRTTAIIISSSEAAEQVLNKKDQAFSSRMVFDGIHALDHHKFSLIFLPPSDHWRNLRKICNMQIFSGQRLDASQGLRQKVLQQLLDHAGECCSGGKTVDVGRAAFITIINTLSNTFFSVDLAHYDSDSSQEFEDLICRLLKEAAKFNLADFFPGFNLVDLQGIKKRVSLCYSKMMEIFDSFINQRLELKSSSADGDVLDSLLNLNREHDHELSCNDIRHLLIDIFVAGTDAVASAIEWGMSELLKNPKAMDKAQIELRQVVGKYRKIEESDIPKLSYLQAVVKETLRLHPTVPFLVPRMAAMDTELLGYVVPKHAEVLVNAWAIGRDSRTWANPDSFEPERFLDSEIDLKGQDFQLIPFGSGRRICPGLPLGHRMVHMVLASLLHSFDWKLGDGIKPEGMDMSEKFGFTLQKAQPLRAIPTTP